MIIVVLMLIQLVITAPIVLNMLISLAAAFRQPFNQDLPDTSCPPFVSAHPLPPVPASGSIIMFVVRCYVVLFYVHYEYHHHHHHHHHDYDYEYDYGYYHYHYYYYYYYYYPDLDRESRLELPP